MGFPARAVAACLDHAGAGRPDLRQAGLGGARLACFDHHTAHGAAAYYGPRDDPHEPYLVLTCDGFGEGACTTVAVWETRMAKLLGNRAAARACIAALSIPASAGHLLTQLTRTPPPDVPGTGPGQIRQARTDTGDRRDRWLAAAILAAAGDAPALDAVRAMVITVEWAAESEERRRDLRERYLSLAAAWCARTDLSMQAVTIADISTRAGAD